MLKARSPLKLFRRAAMTVAKRLPRGTAMYEQVLVQSRGYRITLLTVDEAEAEDEDDEYVRDLRSSPRLSARRL